MGQALYAAQCGEEYPTVKALRRAVYTVRFADAIYVLHAFQKKSTKGIGTPKRQIELIQQRLAAAERDYREKRN